MSIREIAVTRCHAVIASCCGCLVFASAQVKGQTYTLKTLASFNTGTPRYPNGDTLQGTVTRDAQGNLYGTANDGGASGDGTVYELVNTGTVANPVYTGSINVLASFSGTNGHAPYCDLKFDSNGNLFGTTTGGGTSGDGTVFELVNAGSALSPAYTTGITSVASFNGSNGSGGISAVSIDSIGNLFGTTDSGDGNFGTVFEIGNSGTTATPAYSGNVTTLGTFTGVNGFSPIGGLTLDGSGNLYGTTVGGGSGFGGTSAGNGVVFKIAASTSTLTTLASFTGANGDEPNGVILDSKGDLFGTTSDGGASNDGTIFEIAAGTSTITTLATFTGTNGSIPLSGLTVDSAGNLFGTTQEGGSTGFGTVYELAAGASSVTTLTTFTGGGVTGVFPRAGITLDPNGNLYGTTTYGGQNGGGTVFELALTASAAPEPYALMLVTAAIPFAAGIMVRRRRRDAA